MVTFMWAERTVTRNMEEDISTSPRVKNTWGSSAEEIFMDKAFSTVRKERCCTMESGEEAKDVTLDHISCLFNYQSGSKDQKTAF